MYRVQILSKIVAGNDTGTEPCTDSLQCHILMRTYIIWSDSITIIVFDHLFIGYVCDHTFDKTVAPFYKVINDSQN